LVLSAFVCNVNLSAANIALPDIGDEFGSGQTTLNLISLGCSLGLAMSVLYLGAVADRYGRQQLLRIGLGLTMLTSLLAAFALGTEVLIVARVLTGVAAGMAYPTTLSLITALWAPGPRRVVAITIWSSVSATSIVAGSVLAGVLLNWFWWGAAFLMAVPFAALALVLVWVFVPTHVRENSDPVDHLGGVVSVFAVAALVIGINDVFAPTTRALGGWLLAAAVALFALFGWLQRNTVRPLFELSVARRRLFWVPALGGLIVVGSLMGLMYVGQQFLQSVLGYSALGAGLATIPAAVGLLVMIHPTARMVTAHGIRATILVGYALVFLAFVSTLFWREHTPYALIGFGFLIAGAGVAVGSAPASQALTSSTPVRRVGMASATSDLQRDLGGALMQALLGAILASGFAKTFEHQIDDAGQASEISDRIMSALLASYSSAVHVADAFPRYRAQIIEAARQSFVDGALAAYFVGAVSILLGAVIVRLLLPDHEGEKRLLAEYRVQEGAGRDDR
jgi:MFS transporter, DHA2 family, multidrug resistance protein